MARIPTVAILSLALLLASAVAAGAEAPTVTPVAGFSLSKPQDAVALGNGELVIADTAGNRVLWYQSGSTRTLTGLSKPTSVAPADDGGIYVTDALNHRVVHFTRAGVRTTVAGTGANGALVENVLALLTPVEEPEDVLAWNKGFLVADRKNGRVLRVKEDKKLKTLVSGPRPPDGPRGGGRRAPDRGGRPRPVAGVARRPADHAALGPLGADGRRRAAGRPRPRHRAAREPDPRLGPGD